MRWLPPMAVACVLFSYSSGLPIKTTGAPADGGQDCTLCHRMVAADARGRVSIEAASYAPGATQKIRVTVTHPEAARWGFQLTARVAGQETRAAGSFTANPEVRVLCAPEGKDGPCQGALEFAAHNTQSTASTTAGSKSWEVEWRAPGPETGKVRFYAAGLAANGSRSTTGDFTYTTSVEVAAASQPPSIRSVVNGASFLPGLAPNTMITIFGAGFAAAGTQRAAGPSDYVDGRFPKELAGVSVEVAGERAPICFVSESQINAQAPSRSLTGPVKVAVSVHNVRTEISGVLIENFAPAFFTFGDGRSIAAQHATYEYLADPSLVAGGRQARPGDTVILYGTGFGPTEPFWQAGELAGGAARLREAVSVTIGGLALRAEEVVYAGLSPGSISGLYQLNVRIPESAGEGNAGVAARIGGLQTQPGVTIPVKR